MSARARSSCFLNKNRKDFDDPPLVDELKSYGCKLLPSFDRGRECNFIGEQAMQDIMVNRPRGAVRTLMTPATQYARQHARRVAVLFTAWFVPTTALDLVITWIGIKHLPDRMQKFGIVEANPYTDLSSVEAFVTPEVLALVIGAAFVYVGGLLKGRRLAILGKTPDDLRGMGFRAFCTQYQKPGLFAFFLVLIPIVVAVARVEPVVNNLMWLAIGWGPTALLGATFTHFVACMLAAYPSIYMIQKWAL